MTNDIIQETWRPIPFFSLYEISDLGNVLNVRRNRVMRTSVNNFGHVKISLIDDYGIRHTLSVAQLVAEAFVEPPNPLCDCVVIKDGDYYNLAYENLAWRPRWYAWKYTRQLKTHQPLYFKNLPVIDITTGDRYNSILAAGIREGLLFEDIWRSCNTGASLFPTGAIFEVVNR